MANEFQFYVQMLVVVTLAAAGWILTHQFTSRRDRKNAERLLRVDALRLAYFAFTRLGTIGSFTKRDHEGKIIPIAEEIEKAVATIHLFGSNEQSQMASTYTKQLSTTGKGDQTELIDSLRETIRRELGLAKLVSRPVYMRINISNPDKDIS